MVDVLHSNCTTLLGLLGCNKSLTFRTKKYNSNKEIIFRNSAIPIFYGFRQNLIVFFMFLIVFSCFFCSGILVPGGFGKRGTEGKIAAAEWGRKMKKPYLGKLLS